MTGEAVADRDPSEAARVTVAVASVMSALEELTVVSRAAGASRAWSAPSLFVDNLHPSTQLAVLRAAAAEGAAVDRDGGFVRAVHPDGRWTIRALTKAVCRPHQVVTPVTRTEYDLPEDLVHHVEPPC